MADEELKDYPVTDKQTGDRWVIRATSPERAREVAALRRAAKQGKLKYDTPADEPTLLSFLKESAEAPYKGEAEDLPGFFGSLKRTYGEGLGAAGRLLVPPFMRSEEPEKFDPAKRFGEAGGDVLKVIGMAPPVAAMQATSDQAGKVTRLFGGSPLLAAGVSQAVGLGYPGLQKWNRARAEAKLSQDIADIGKVAPIEQRVSERLFGKDRIPIKETERITEAQKPSLQEAEQLRTRRAELAAANAAKKEGTEIPGEQVKRLQEARGAITKEKQAEEAAVRKIQEAETLHSLSESEMRMAKEDLRTFPEVAKSAADAVKKRLAQTPVSEFEFGERFKGAEFQPKGQPSGYYREAEALRREQVNVNYGEVRKSLEGKTIDAGEVLKPILDDLKQEGVAVQIAPTKAERLAGRMEQELDPLTHEQQAYGTILEKLTPEQRQRLRAGSAGGMMPLDIYRALFQDVLPEAARAGTTSQGSIGALAGRLKSREQQVLEALDTISVPKELSGNQALAIRQRINGAIRAAERSKDFNLSRQLRRYKESIDRAISTVDRPSLEKLAEADLYNAREYAPYFDPRSKLFKINQQKAASIVDSLVSKDDPRLTQKALSILSPEGKDALKGAWIQRVFENALDDFGGKFTPKKLAETYRSYLPEVREAMLGAEGAKEMDQLIDGLVKRTEELQGIQRGAAERMRGATAAKEAAGLEAKAAKGRRVEAEAGAKAALGSVERTIKSGKESADFADQANKAFLEGADKLARQTIKFAQEEANRRIPHGIHQIMGMSNLQVQAALGLIDLAEFAAGVGGRRYIVFAARHAIVYTLAKNPELLGRLGKFGDVALKITNRAINGNPLGPGYTNTARAFWELAQQANVEARRERGEENVNDETGEAGSANP